MPGIATQVGHQRQGQWQCHWRCAPAVQARRQLHAADAGQVDSDCYGATPVPAWEPALVPMADAVLLTITYVKKRRCGEPIPKQVVTVQLQHSVVPGYSRAFRLQTGAALCKRSMFAGSGVLRMAGYWLPP